MIRIGILDFDTSHSIEFTRRFNHVGVESDQYVEGAQVVLGWPGTSAMAPERIAGFTKQIVECGVELVDRPEDMLGRIDAVIVHSLSGIPHLERVRPFIQAGLPAFVDKPFACSIADAVEMARLAAENNVMLFSTSALRFSTDVEQFQQQEHLHGALHGVVSYGPAKRATGNPGLFHYGIHPTELLFSLMGPGCRRVSTTYTAGTETCQAEWTDGRLATLRGNRQGSTVYGFLAFCENAVVHRLISARYAYRNLCRQIVRSFETGTAAVPIETSLEIVRFITASMESEQNDGHWVSLESVG